YQHALHLVGPAQVVMASALERTGISEMWAVVVEHVDAARASGALERRRAEQAREWMWAEVTDTLVDRLRADPEVRALVTAMEEDVAAGRCSPAAAAQRLLAAYR